MNEASYQTAFLGRRPGFPERVDSSADGHFPPHGRSSVRAEALCRMHHEDPIGGQPVYLLLWAVPFRGLFL